MNAKNEGGGEKSVKNVKNKKTCIFRKAAVGCIQLQVIKLPLQTRLASREAFPTFKGMWAKKINSTEMALLKHNPIKKESLVVWQLFI